MIQIKNSMKKLVVILVVGISLVSCGGGWSCHKRYCKVKTEMQKTTPVPSNENVEAVAQP